jgi:lipid-A-disaccharide synthase
VRHEAAVRLFLIAGEPSGDALGAALIRGLRALWPGTLALSGVGGPRMQAEGLNSLFPMEELSVMGLAEILPRYLDLRRRLAQTAEAVVREAPDALITIDSPDFCLRVARAARARRPELRTIHYVAPTVWAWRPGRAARMAQVIDHVLALLPFEPAYMRAAGMSCDFVGHPVIETEQAGAEAARAFRARHDIAPQAPLVLALPGSRRGEVTRLAPVFGAALARVAAHRPGLRVVLPTVRGVAGLARSLSQDWSGDPVLLDPADSDEADKRAAFAAADAALAASGTVSLELAAAGVPMVIGYDFNLLTRLVVARMLRIDTVVMVNLVSETRAVPEFLGPACTPARIAPALEELLDAGPAREAQRAAMAETMIRLGQGGEAPGRRAARSVLASLGRQAIPVQD